MICKLKVEGKTPSPLNRPNNSVNDWMILICSVHKDGMIRYGSAFQARCSQAMRAFTCKTRGTVWDLHGAERKQFHTRCR